jgi:hypothetical protein
MMAVEAFGIEKEFLGDLLTEAGNGKAQLPEFQRGWVWPMENIRSLLASISLGYPIGTLMMLRTGGDVRFKQRPIEGVSPNGKADRLILDGQQRLTSLSRRSGLVARSRRKMPASASCQDGSTSILNVRWMRTSSEKRHSSSFRPIAS